MPTTTSISTREFSHEFSGNTKSACVPGKVAKSESWKPPAQARPTALNQDAGLRSALQEKPAARCSPRRPGCHAPRLPRMSRHLRNPSQPAQPALRMAQEAPAPRKWATRPRPHYDLRCPSATRYAPGGIPCASRDRQFWFRGSLGEPCRRATAKWHHWKPASC